MIFAKKDNGPDQGLSVGVTFGRKKLTEGEVGLEIEVEGNKFPKPDDYCDEPHPITNRWHAVKDHSLRGEDNCEYVLKKPVMFGEVNSSVDEIWACMNDYGSVLSESNRTSVHVHLNVQPFYLNRLTALMATYVCFEEVLTEWCGEHRVGNLFCLRAKDAPAIISQIRRFIRSDMQAKLFDHHHYAGMNAHAIFQHGSLEFRPLRGVLDPEVIKDWVGILRRLYELSAEFTDPRDIPAKFSSMGPLAFFDNILGDKSPLVRQGIKMSTEAIRDSMYEGVRLAQDLCYSKDWSMFKPLDLQPDPFNRDVNTIVKKLQSAESSTATDDLLNSFLDHEIPEYESLQWDAPPTISVGTLPGIQQVQIQSYGAASPTTQALNSFFNQPNPYDQD